MRLFLALMCVVTLAGCAVGTPASLAPVSRQAMEPVSTYGFNPVVRQAVGIPVGATKCVTGFLARGIADAVQTLDCVLDTLIPVVVPPASAPQAAPQSAPCAPAPQYVPAPKSTPVCQNGSCAVSR